MTKTIQIVCFNVPFPADYGGSIDVFYQIKALHQAGCRLILHCFCYRDFKPQKEIEELASQVYYYVRNEDVLQHLGLTPFIVKSRIDNTLVDNLNENPFPILFQGIHTTGIIGDELIERLPKYLRAHNIESSYYARIAGSESNLIKKSYLAIESRKLRAYESHLWDKGIHVVPISGHDAHYLKAKSAHLLPWIPPFHPFDEVVTKTGLGSHILVHADFSITENRKSAISIIDNVVRHIDFPFVFAGKKASVIKDKKRQLPANLQLESDVSSERMLDLLGNAQITIAQSQNSEGFKLKLLYSLFAGRHCIGNQKIVHQTTLQDLVHVVENNTEMVDKIESLLNVEWTSKMSEEREQILFPRFDNLRNAKRLMEIIS